MRVNLRKPKSNKGSGRRERGESSQRTVASQEPSFRRNRTLAKAPTAQDTERARIHRLRAVRRRIGLVLISLVTIGSLSLFGLSQFSASVDISTHGDEPLSKPVDEGVYRDAFEEYYYNYPLERFRFLTNYNRLTALLRQKAPEVASVSPAGMASVGVSQYRVELRRPVASWVVSDTRYYVDADGVTFTKNYFDDPKVTVVDNSGARIAEGSAVASSRLLSFVGRAISLAAESGVVIDSVEVPAMSMRYLHIKGKDTPVIKMTIDRGVEVQVADMAASLKHFASGGRDRPTYVDVRVAGKAFYK